LPPIFVNNSLKAALSMQSILDKWVSPFNIEALKLRF
jgi:hypothetical protein